MERLHSDILRELSAVTEGPCVSVYVPNVPDAGKKSDPISRLQLALDEIEKHLPARGLSAKGCVQFVAPARALIEGDLDFSAPDGGLAVFLSPSVFHAYQLSRKTPARSVMGSRFHLIPLLHESNLGRHRPIDAEKPLAAGLHLALPNAVLGKVETLLLAEDAVQWGSMHAKNGDIATHDAQEEGDEELLGLALAHTLAHGGDAMLLPLSDMPEGQAVAAVLR